MQRRSICALSIALFLVLSGCGGSNEDTTSANTAPTSPPAEAPATEADPEPGPTPAEAPNPTAVPQVYDAPGGLEIPLPLEAGVPGQVVADEPVEIEGAIAGRILYHSETIDGEDTIVSGFFAYPDGEVPDGGWPLIAWAHGTTGLGDSCAPSHDAETDQVAKVLVDFGFAVVATDYEGLGTPGVHPYVVGASEAHSVLDSVRAVHFLDLPVTDRWVAFGHSQGGHAAMFTGQLHSTYAPELELIGVVAGAPPSQMAELSSALIGSDFQGYLIMTASGLAAAYDDISLDEVLTTEALELIEVVETGCTSEIFDVYNGLDYADVSSVDDPFVLPSWGPAVDENDTRNLPVEVPLLILHGEQDEQIPIETSATLLTQLCEFERQGPTVRKVYPGQSHAGVLASGAAVPDLLTWVNARFAGELAPDDCHPSIDQLLSQTAPLNIAHAGGDLEAPHSTLFAFDQAVAAGADVLELDVLTTADGVVIVQHDLTVDKTTETTGAVRELTLAELDALDNAYWFSEQCWPCQDRPIEEYLYRGVRTGEVPPPAGAVADDFSITTLREVSERYPSLPLDIEIKGEDEYGVEVAIALAAELTELGRLESTIVVSFDDTIIDAFHEAAPTVAISPGTNAIATWLLTDTPLDEKYRIIQIPPFAQGLDIATAETITRAHAEGLEVWVWPNDAATQENFDFYFELIDIGADGIIAGRPVLMADAKATFLGE